MKCPSCQNSLVPLGSPAAELDVCPGCKGVWFDWQELKKFDNPEEFLPQDLEVPAETPDVDYSGGARDCPKCSGAFMCRRSFDVQDAVEVDQCLRCSGIWLDGGELTAIRGLYPSEQARSIAEDAWLEARLVEAKAPMEFEIDRGQQEIARNKRTARYRLFQGISNILRIENF